MTKKKVPKKTPEQVVSDSFKVEAPAGAFKSIELKIGNTVLKTLKGSGR